MMSMPPFGRFATSVLDKQAHPDTGAGIDEYGRDLTARDTVNVTGITVAEETTS